MSQAMYCIYRMPSPHKQLIDSHVRLELQRGGCTLRSTLSTDRCMWRIPREGHTIRGEEHLVRRVGTNYQMRFRGRL
jgi:hypothetical protein